MEELQMGKERVNAMLCPWEPLTLPTSASVHQPRSQSTLPLGFLWRLRYTDMIDKSLAAGEAVNLQPRPLCVGRQPAPSTHVAPAVSSQHINTARQLHPSRLLGNSKSFRNSARKGKKT